MENEHYKVIISVISGPTYHCTEGEMNITFDMNQPCHESATAALFTQNVFALVRVWIE